MCIRDSIIGESPRTLKLWQLSVTVAPAIELSHSWKTRPISVLVHEMTVSRGMLTNCGPVKSCTWIVCSNVSIFPQTSFAIHVLASCSWQSDSKTILSWKVVIAEEQLSVTSTNKLVSSKLASQSMASILSPLILGGRESTNVITWEVLTVFPHASSATQISVSYTHLTLPTICSV